MSDPLFQSLSQKERLDSLNFAPDKSGVQANLLEKDIWVVQVLETLFGAPFGRNLTFKGGTSLSKVYRAIRRFSEDIDITYDIRALAPSLAAPDEIDPLPSDSREGRKWRDKIEPLLNAWVSEEALPAIQGGLSMYDAEFTLDAREGCVFVHYAPLLGDEGFVRPPVKVEFGARSTGDPRYEALVKCDAADWTTGVVFPTANSHVMLAERTFGEKATAAHVFCLQKRQRGKRQSRHWYDLAALDKKGLAEKALTDVGTAIRVARHKNVLFPENDSTQQNSDFLKATSGNLQLVPKGEAYRLLADDYQTMLDGGMVPETDQTFDNVMQACEDLQNRANSHPRIHEVAAILQSQGE